MARVVCSIWNKFTAYKLWQKLLHLRMKEAQEQGREGSEEQRKRNLPVSSDPESEALMSSTIMMIAPFPPLPLPPLKMHAGRDLQEGYPKDQMISMSLENPILEPNWRGVASSWTKGG